MSQTWTGPSGLVRFAIRQLRRTGPPSMPQAAMLALNPASQTRISAPRLVLVLTTVVSSQPAGPTIQRPNSSTKRAQAKPGSAFSASSTGLVATATASRSSASSPSK